MGFVIRALERLGGNCELRRGSGPRLSAGADGPIVRGNHLEADSLLEEREVHTGFSGSCDPLGGPAAAWPCSILHGLPQSSSRLPCRPEGLTCCYFLEKSDVPSWRPPSAPDAGGPRGPW